MNAQLETLTTSLSDYMNNIGQRARAASRIIGSSETRAKNAALLAMADAIAEARPQLLEISKRGAIKAWMRPCWTV